MRSQTEPVGWGVGLYIRGQGESKVLLRSAFMRKGEIVQFVG